MSISVRYIVAAACCVAVLFAASLFLGSVPIPLRAVLGILTGGEAGQASWSFIVLESRLPQAVTALLAGAALATSGLMLQTVFNNPLAGPSILGIDTGASLGVALVMLMLGGTVGGTGGFMLSGYMAVVSGAFVGAAAVLCIIIFFFDPGAQQRDVADYRDYGRLPGLVDDLAAEFFRDVGRRVFPTCCGGWAIFRAFRCGICRCSRC